MNLEDFIKNYENQKIDFDGFYGSQCVDLFRQYSKEVLGIKEHTGAVNGAKELYINFELMPLMKKHFQKVFAARKGDLVVFNGTENNPYGHIAIVIYATPKTIITFEQDGFNQDKGCYFNFWNYDRVLGFLRKR